jgi:alkyl hydroperoxide reductase subunit AhpC
MDKRNFMRYVAASALVSVSATGYSQQPPVHSIRHTLSGTDGKGEPITLDDFSGKVCLVSFFTAGCNLCTNDLKLMREFYMSNKKRNFVLIGVNMDENQNDYMQYIRLISLSIPKEERFPILWRKAPAHSDNFGNIRTVPTHFVLDKEHRELSHREGSFLPSDWDDLWSNLN